MLLPEHQSKDIENCLVLFPICPIRPSNLLSFKGKGSRNCKQTCDLYDLCCCPHVAIVFCKNSGGWGESTRKLLPNIHQYLCNRKTNKRWVLFSSKLKSPSSNNTFILRKTVENLCDMAYQKYCKIVISKEVCLHYVTIGVFFPSKLETFCRKPH